jgi:AAA+ superfamily predicted ATPase
MMTVECRDASRVEESAFLERIRLRAQRRVLWLRALWASSASLADQGLAISHSEVDRILTGPDVLAKAERHFYATDAAAQSLAEPIAAADQRVADDPTFQHLRRTFGLAAAEVDLLTLAVAAEIDPLLRRVYGYLHDDTTACYPTPWLAACLFPDAPPWHFGPEGVLAQWRLAWPQEGAGAPWALTTPWVADPAIVALLLSAEETALGAGVTRMPVGSVGGSCLYPAALADMEAFAQAMRAENALREAQGLSSAPVEIIVIGPEGAGKRTLAAQCCARLDQGILVADAGALLGPDIGLAAAVERALRAARAARLANAVLYWHNAAAAHPQVWDVVSAHAALTVFGAPAPLVLPKRPEIARKTLRLPPLTRAQRVALWATLSDRPVPTPVAEWMLTPTEIANAALVAPAGAEAMTEACRRPLTQGPGELFTLLPCPYTWDDLVLPPVVQRHIAEVAAQARWRWAVYEEWGFERLCPLGRGITALFAGPSGTGKTMAAQVIARSLGLEVYRVDLASVMSKYIGETEKNLKRIFDACERANVLLFFDEADALFGQRTQVKDAHDRFANIEIDYLLQRMEQFDGIAILATNRKGELDEAFLRRIRFLVDFVSPGPQERLALWQRALSDRAPTGEVLLDPIDWQVLAERLMMTGADIKAAALNAAFLARAEGTRITMQHILHAARREMSKHGLVLRTGDLEAAHASNHN